jgi:hypothetical protein
MEPTTGVATHPVNQVSVISEDDCARVCEDIYALRDRWTHRHDTRPFYTLGVPSYMDATRGRFASYREASERLNPILEERFDWLYERLADALVGAGYKPCLHDARLAHPGFHIFLGDGETRPTPPSVHYDLQYQHIDWSPYGSVDLTCPLSFTLALRLPAKGGGLFVWDVDVHALQQLPEDQRRACLFDKRLSTYQAYRPGEMVVHNGHYLHQIARLSDLEPGEARITLQGHAVSTDRGWVVYW